MTTISIHLANTSGGHYDVRLPLPKPLHCHPVTGSIIRKGPEYALLQQVIGFVEGPDDEPEDIITWHEWQGEFEGAPDPILGWLPVVADLEGFATLTLPVSGVSVDGRRIGHDTHQDEASA